jgi:hypothetical protein
MPNTKSSSSDGRKPGMADPKDSAPDLELLGDQVTFQPRGYIEPLQSSENGDKERNLVEHMARFRTSPLE